MTTRVYYPGLSITRQREILNDMEELLKRYKMRGKERDGMVFVKDKYFIHHSWETSRSTMYKPEICNFTDIFGDEYAPDLLLESYRELLENNGTMLDFEMIKIGKSRKFGINGDVIQFKDKFNNEVKEIYDFKLSQKMRSKCVKSARK